MLGCFVPVASCPKTQTNSRSARVLRNKSIPVLIALFMAAMLGDQLPQSERKVRSRERLGGLLRL